MSILDFIKNDNVTTFYMCRRLCMPKFKFQNTLSNILRNKSLEK